MKFNFVPSGFCLALCLGSALAYAQTGRPLNDTGITICRDATGSVAGCTAVATTAPGQDARFGRDAAAGASTLLPAKVGGGIAGFDFSKMSNTNVLVPVSTAVGAASNLHTCTRDNVTGLYWHLAPISLAPGIGTTPIVISPGTYNSAPSYFVVDWYDPNFSTNGGFAGTNRSASGSNPSPSSAATDTNILVAAANAAARCTRINWRLPTARELISIIAFVDGDNASNRLDPTYFPLAVGSTNFWTSQTKPGASSQKFYVAIDSSALVGSGSTYSTNVSAILVSQ
jgi:Protein of unknown function (DUF1566)